MKTISRSLRSLRLLYNLLEKNNSVMIFDFPPSLIKKMREGGTRIKIIE